MKASKLLIAVVFVLSFCAVNFNAAYAGPGLVPEAKSNAATVTHLHTAYYSSLGGDYILSETKVINKNKSFENFGGTISDLNSFPAGTYTSNASGVYFVNGQGYYWNSDFGSGNAKSVTITITDNGDGTGTISGQATF